MAFVHLFTASAGSSDSNNAATGSADTTGCTFFLMLTAWNPLVGTLGTPFSDNKANTWTPIGIGMTLGDEALQWAYCNPTSVGSGHIFSCAGSSSPVPSIIVFGFSGGAGQLVNEVSGGGGPGGSTIAGPITLGGETDILFAAGLCLYDVDTPTANAPFTGNTNISKTADHRGATAVYEIQTASIDRTAVWTFSTSAYGAAYIVGFRAIANVPPDVSAGSNQSILLPPGTFTLAGSMSDGDGPDAVTGLWTVTSGPPAGIITFTDDTDPVTTGSASHHGVYVLRLTADDGEDTAFDEMTLTVNPPSSGTTIAVNDVPLTRIIEDPGRRGIRIEMSLGSLWMCDLETYDNDSTISAYRPELRDVLTLDYEGQRLFRGDIITRRDRPRARTNKGNRMAVRAKANLLMTDRLELDGLEIAAGDTLKDAITAIHTHGTPSLSDEGIALDPGMADGPTLEAVTFDGISIQSAFNRLMDRTGWIIRKTPDDVIESFEPGDMVCAYALTEANGLALGEVTWEETARKFVNRVTVKYGTGRRGNVDTFTGDGVLDTFTLTYPINGYYNYVSDGAVGYGVVDTSYGSGTESLGGPTSPMIWLYDPATLEIFRTTGAVGNLETVTVRYDTDYPLSVTVEDAVSIAAVGLYKKTFELPDVYDIAEATEQAEGLLRSGTSTPKTIEVRTREYPMPLPGDVVNLDYPDRLIPDDDYLIIKVEATDYIFDRTTQQPRFEFVLTCVEGTEVRRSWTDTLKSLIGAS